MGTKNFSNANDLITFSRSSAGTALRKIAYGSELVTNGDFDTDISGWTTQAGGSTFTVSSGQLTISRSAVDPGYVYQTISTTAGNVYYVTFGVIDNGPIDLRVGTSPAGLQITSSGIKSSAGTYTLAFVATGASTYISLVNTSYSTDATVDNISVKEVLFDDASGDLTLFNHPAGIPRIEYDADGNRLGLLIEESRTNLLPYSEDFTDAQWSKTYSVAVSPSSEAAPNGQKVAYELTGIESSDGDAGINEFISASASTTYTGTIWFKAKNASDVGKYIRLRLKRNGGTFVAQDESVQLTNSWVRHEVTLTLLSDNTGIGFIITKDSTQNTVDRADECLIYGAQLEAGAFPTSYIPTAGATATRSADVASIPVADFGYNQSEGTVVVEGQTIESNADSRFFTLSDGTNNNRISFSRGSTYHPYVATGGAAQASLAAGTVNAGTLVKAAAAFRQDDIAGVIDGGSVATDTSAAIPSVNKLYLAAAATGLIRGACHIKSIKYYPRRLTNAQLQELTT